MVSTCAVHGCTNKYRNNKKISFHIFPKNPIILEKWLLSMRRENLIPSKGTRLCSEHFLPEDFVVNFGRKTLKHDAVPSIFNFSEHLISKPTPSSPTVHDMTNTRELEWNVGNMQETASASNDVCEVMNDSQDIKDMIKVEYSDNNIEETALGNNVCDMMNDPLDIKDIKDIVKVEYSIDNIDETASASTHNFGVMNANHQDVTNIVEVKCSVDNIKENALASDHFCSSMNSSQDISDIEDDECSVDNFQENALDKPDFSNQSIEPKCKRKRNVPAYVGDIEPSDLEKPEKFKLMWEIATKTITRQRKTIKYLQTKLRRSTKKIDTLSELITHLKNGNKKSTK
ncbi:THAP domain-containing protein 1-like [Harmonia axyridis]|uniref:THAP domain-containing protein 1-like n=1 Tax=Harmonia axyridis TaxID=115357 RepID=UPI001E278AF1|nr:THAP domain-containing protein 1-like [Harmonia axyridis]